MTNLPESPIELAGRRGVEPSMCTECGARFYAAYVPVMCTDCATGPLCPLCLDDHELGLCWVGADDTEDEL